MGLRTFFEQRCSQQRPLVLVTVYETAGSTYSKAGGRMIIDADGNFCGMLSGGCLEGDLVERARQVIDTGEAETVTYDLSADDELWGLGVGCDGAMRVLLQPLLPEAGYQPFAAIAEVSNGGKPAVLAIVVQSESQRLPLGASVLLRDEETSAFGCSDPAARQLADASDFEGTAARKTVATAGANASVLYTRIAPAPALLILGAGLDSEPVARFAAELGWRITVADHRPLYVEGRCYPDPTRVLCCEATALHASVDLGEYDMAIVMSHHLASDRAYLRQLAQSDIAYVGLLGPSGRRDRLLNDLGATAAGLEGRLHGPAGIVLGGRGPGPIALEIIAEMQQYLADRS